jgi:mannose-binding lectin 2
MMGDGKTAYDHDHDNDANELGACSVSLAPWRETS